MATSPSLYDQKLSVPTWNYVAVHVYGEVTTVHDAADKDALLKRLIGRNEPGYAQQWRDLPEDFQQKMLAPSSAYGWCRRGWKAVQAEPEPPRHGPRPDSRSPARRLRHRAGHG